jgi:hypothetical protein
MDDCINLHETGSPQVTSRSMQRAVFGKEEQDA